MCRRREIGAHMAGQPRRSTRRLAKRDRKTFEFALRERDERMRAIVETAVDAIITIDERGTIDWANPATEKLFGYNHDEMVGRNVKMLMPEPYRGEHDQYLANYIRTGKAKIIGIGREVVAMRKDGTTFPINLAVSALRLGNRRLFTGIVHDLSDRRKLEQQIIEASTTEQRRIAQDLHDGLCQELVGVALRTDLIAKRMAAQSVEYAQPLQDLASSVRDIAGQARRMSHGLNPVDLNAGGLPAALSALAKRVSESFGITCKFRADSQATIELATVATQLYRVAQESINNAIRHGKAHTIEIRLTATKKNLMMTVADDGIGFSPPKISTPDPHAALTATEGGTTTGIGLASMRYRANMIGGIFDVRRRGKRGTIVSVAIRAPQPSR
jgi:two-component system, LuxR family, sensor kinase FixL